jgi:hypothetical protein
MDHALLSYSKVASSVLYVFVYVSLPTEDGQLCKMYVKVQFLSLREQTDATPVNAFQGSNYCLFQEWYKALKYTVWEECGVVNCYSSLCM